jgi:hypothetical protein
MTAAADMHELTNKYSRVSIQLRHDAYQGQSDPPRKNHGTRSVTQRSSIKKHFKWGPDQIRDQNTTPSITMPRSQGLITRLQQYFAKY